jgi:hypothetical integral membrane protein (TIGR02206 family)
MVWGNLHTFQPYSAKHVIVLAGAVVLIGAMLRLARAVPEARRPGVEQAAGVLLLLIWFAGAAAKWAVPYASARTALPLHWCDLAGILAGVVLLQPTPAARAALHFWGICFSSLAFLMPIEKRGPAYYEFWLYFGTHGAILFAVMYDRLVRGYVPTWQDWRYAVLATVFWAAAVTPFNLVFGSNYAYLGAVEHYQRSIVLMFGEWPTRLAPMYLVAIALMALTVWVQRGFRIGARERSLATEVASPAMA